jgi:drug/metabolite transporter (DMT)-like permease
MLNRSSDSPGSTIISRRTVAHMALVAVALFWGLNNIVMKIGFREFDPIVFGGLRMLLITLPAILAGRFAPGYQPFVRKDLLAVSGISFVGFSGFLVLFPLGIARVSVPVGGVLMGTMPVWAVLILIAAGMQRISLRALAGVLLTVGGITLIALFGGSSPTTRGSSVSGVVLVAGAELLFAVNTVFLRPYLRKYSVPQVTAVGIALAAVFYLFLIVPRLSSVDFRSISPAAWGAVLYSGGVALFGANLAWNAAVSVIGSEKTAVYANLPPVFVLLFGVVFFGETLHGLQAAGALIIAAGIVLVQIRKK